MKAPLAIYLVYHSNYNDSEKVFSELYKLFCRDVRSSLSDGLDIPVYYSTDKNSYAVDFNRAYKTCVIICSDSNLVMDKDRMIRKIEEWCELEDYENSIMLCPVKLHKYAFDILPQRNQVQCINLTRDNILEDWLEFQTKIFDCLIRFIRGRNTKAKIFVSHSKRDKDQIGEKYAKEIVKYLTKETTLDAFFDIKDIVPGNRFDKQIEDGIKNALLIILYTNTYSDREWCRRELIAAKDNNVPTIVVLMTDGVVKRTFPYVGNIPSIAFNGEWREPINLLLRTALDEYHEELLLNTIAEGDGTVYVIPCPPELYNIRCLPNEKNKLLYPEPPLGQEELTILRQVHKDVDFVTPMEYASANLQLLEKNIAISISDSEDSSTYGVGQEILDDLSIEISKYILKAGGKMIYGGDLRNSGFTELFADLSFQYGIYEKTDSTVKYFKNFLAWPYHEKLDENTILEYDHNRVELIRVDQGIDDSDSLSKMRYEMENEAHARILIGGKMNDFAGSMPGVIEEFKIALNFGHPIYVIGGFGGAARYIADVMSNKCEVKDRDNWMFGLSYECLGNGLSDEENNKLFTTQNIIEIVSLVLKGLKNVL